MINTFAEQYIQFLGHLQVLLKNPTGSIPVDILRGISIILTAAFLSKHLYSSFAFSRLRRRFSLHDSGEKSRLYRIFSEASAKCGMKHVPKLYLFSDVRPLIFAAGLLRPAVFVAPGLARQLSDEELEAALIHELQHIKRKDALYVLLVDMITALIPVLTILLCGFSLIFSHSQSWIILSASVLMIPLFRSTAKRRIIMARELSCDDSTIRIVKDPLLLAGALVKVWKMGSKLPQFSFRYALSNAQPLFTADHEVSRRVTRLLEYRKPVFRTVMFRSAAVMFVCLVMFVSFRMYQFNQIFSEAGIVVGEDHLQIRLQKNADTRTEDYLIRQSPFSPSSFSGTLHEHTESMDIRVEGYDLENRAKHIEVRLKRPKPESQQTENSK